MAALTALSTSLLRHSHPVNRTSNGFSLTGDAGLDEPEVNCPSTSLCQQPPNSSVLLAAPGLTVPCRHGITELELQPRTLRPARRLHGCPEATQRLSTQCRRQTTLGRRLAGAGSTRNHGAWTKHGSSRPPEAQLLHKATGLKQLIRVTRITRALAPSIPRKPPFRLFPQLLPALLPRPGLGHASLGFGWKSREATMEERMNPARLKEQLERDAQVLKNDNQQRFKNRA